MTRTFHAITFALALAVGAIGCNKGGGEAGAGGAGAEGGAASGALTFEQKTFAYDVLRNADQRRMTLVAKVDVPTGWSADPNAKTAGHNMTTLLPNGGVGAKNAFALSNVTISATCHGQCTADKFPEQIKGVAAQQAKFAASATVLKDEQIRDGVWGFVIEAPNGDAKAYTVGVTHWHSADWPYVIFCNAHLQGDEAAQWQQIYDACAAADVSVEDALMPADVLAREAANLAKCPEKTTLTYTADPVREGEPTELGDVVSVYANTSSPGHVYVWIANFELTTTRFNKAPLTGDQRVVKLAFEHRKEGEVLSGSYGAGYEEDVRVAPSVIIDGGRTLQWSAQSTTGTVDIIARTPDKICGHIALEGGNRGKLSGDFVADLTFGSAK
ncbi:MAG: hypothetical protein CVU56_08820 [Deltaproteobacteria bacterium HGW-Deltaproteobacteria-14]|jgi:hypothetical protein|nr:MAG: hypothetical protein CVU56_08820 [Deltaproteobacteria bacterium HGW-Deltaproteobacteria-14]